MIEMTEDQKRIAQLENEIEELKSHVSVLLQTSVTMTKVIDRNTLQIKSTAKAARLGLISLRELLAIHEQTEHTSLQ